MYGFNVALYQYIYILTFKHTISRERNDLKTGKKSWVFIYHGH